MDTRNSVNLERIANAVENIAHELSQPKQNTTEFRVAALRRQSTATAYLDVRINTLLGQGEKYAEHLRDLREIRSLLIG